MPRTTRRKNGPRVLSKLRRPALETRTQPIQQRSSETFDHILKVTASLLEKVGIERISTNMICRHAGLTPPALYRYFPNKYAVLKELGARLMECQNNAFLTWLRMNRMPGPTDSRELAAQRLREIQEITNAVTREFPAAAWIMRAMRAVPALHQVRFDSHNFVAARSLEDLRDHYPRSDEAELRVAVRLATEVMYAATEMVFDDPKLDPDKINTEVADMVVRYFDKFAQREAQADAADPAPAEPAWVGMEERPLRSIGKK